MGGFSVTKSCLTPAALQASLSFTISQSLLKLMSIESVMPSNHLILCWPLLLLPSTFPSNSVFSDESVLHIRWPKYWNLSFKITTDCDCSLEIKRYLLLGRKVMTHLDSILKSKDITLPTKVHLVKAIVFLSSHVWV